MLGKRTFLKRINLEHKPEWTLNDVLFLFEIHQRKIKPETKTTEKFEFGAVNRTRHTQTVKYTLNLNGIHCEARRIDSWLEHPSIENYYHEQKSIIDLHHKGGRNIQRKSYDMGGLLRYCPGMLNPRVRSAVDRIAEMSKQHTGK